MKGEREEITADPLGGVKGQRVEGWRGQGQELTKRWLELLLGANYLTPQCLLCLLVLQLHRWTVILAVLMWHLCLQDVTYPWLMAWLVFWLVRWVDCSIGSWINASGLITINVILQAHAINVFITLHFFSFLVLINMRKWIFFQKLVVDYFDRSFLRSFIKRNRQVLSAFRSKFKYWYFFYFYFFIFGWLLSLFEI